ncbi:uncharacterized protein [Lepisosteus oculatus]|uniref:uncharacterized protein isoform X1 n=1 Tax=Lepisosteus oculatus TaxID=7918 RepID=UPI0035F51C7B
MWVISFSHSVLGTLLLFATVVQGTDNLGTTVGSRTSPPTENTTTVKNSTTPATATEGDISANNTSSQTILSSTTVLLSTSTSPTTVPENSEGEDTSHRTTVGQDKSTTSQTTTTGSQTVEYDISSTKNNSSVEELTSSSAGIIILIALIIAIVLIMVIIYIIRLKTRRYSFDLYNKSPEDAGIPLSSVDKDGACESFSAKDTSGNVNTRHDSNETLGSPKDPSSETGQEKPGSETDTKEAEKPEKEGKEGSFGSQIPLTMLDDIELKLDTNDPDTTQSSKTSVESLGDQLNENNNNILGNSLTAKEETAPNLEDTFTEIYLGPSM